MGRKTTNRFLYHISAGLLIGILMILSGCAVRTPADPARGMGPAPEPLAADAWPERFPEMLVDAEEGELGLPRLVYQDDTGFGTAQMIGVFGQGVLYEMARWTQAVNPEMSDERDLAIPDAAAMALVRGEGQHRAWFAATDMTPDEIKRARAGTREEAEVFDGRLRATQLVKREPIGGMDPCGTVIFLGSLTPNSTLEKKLKRELRSRGWLVLDVWLPGNGALLPASAPGGEPTKAKWKHDLTTAYYNFRTRDSRGDSGNLTMLDAGATFSAGLDGFVADRAYAAEAALLWAQSGHPDLAGKPLVLVGASMGALAMATVAARLGDEVDAAVGIGGGVNVGELFFTSSLSGINAETMPYHGDVRDFYDGYLKGSRLDPYHTAPLLTHTPVLVADGMFDTVVPARNGKLLYERLGWPERWSFPTGHLGLFFAMRSRTDEVVDWIETAVNE